MTQEALLKAVDDQRSRLLNVLGAVQCMKVAVREQPPKELEGAVQLLEEELQRILEGLDEFSLRRALSDHYHGAPSEEAQP